MLPGGVSVPQDAGYPRGGVDDPSGHGGGGAGRPTPLPTGKHLSLSPFLPEIVAVLKSDEDLDMRHPDRLR